jgi:hypothetical protein
MAVADCRTHRLGIGVPAEESAQRLLGLCEAVGAQYLVMTVAGTQHLERLIPVIEALRRLSSSQQTATTPR